MSLNVLLVSIAFPPKRDPECLQTAKYFKYLARSNELVVDVVTSSIPTFNMPEDESLKKFDTGFRQKIEVPVPESKLGNFVMRRLFPAKLNMPDSKYKFSFATPQVRRELKNAPSLIYSRSYPLSSAVLAGHLKRAYEVPWVMHLSDPWAGCAVNVLPPKLHQANLVLERDHVDAADLVTVTSQRTLETYQERYPEFIEKFQIFPNVFDPEETNSVDLPRDSSKFRIVHTGGLAGERSPKPFLKVLKRMEHKAPGCLSELDVIFAGDADRGNRRIFADSTLPCVRWVGQLPYEEARSLQLSADLLLCIEVPCPVEDAAFFPSKLLDYMLVGKPILAITTPGSEVDLRFSELGWPSFGHSATLECAEYLHQALQAHREGKQTYREAPPASFSADHNAQRLIKCFADLVQNHENNRSASNQ